MADQKFTATNTKSMLSSRMGWNMEAPRCSFEKWEAWAMTDTVAIIIQHYAHSTEIIVLYDDKDMYPSDELVTKIRMMVG